MTTQEKDHDSQAVRYVRRLGSDVVRVLPFILLLGGWALRVELFMNAGPRFTSLDADLAHAEIREEMNGKIAALPPPNFRREFDELKDDVADLKVTNQEHIAEFREFRGTMTAEMRAVRRLLEN